MYKWLALLATCVVLALAAYFVLNKDRLGESPTESETATVPEPAQAGTSIPEPSLPTEPPQAEDSSAIGADEAPGKPVETANEAVLRLQGVVLDAATDAPIPGAALYIAGRNNRKVEVTSSETGAFVLDFTLKEYWNTGPNFRLVHCEAKGYSRTSKPIGDLDLPAVEDAAPGTVIEERLDFFLGPGASLSGHVFDDATGAVIANVLVQAEDASLSFIEQMQGPRSNLAQAKTDEEGAYAIDTLAPGSYRLRATARETGYVQEASERIAVSVVAGDRKSGVDIRMVLGGTLSGSVRDGSGAPLAGASIVLLPGNPMEFATGGMQNIPDMNGLAAKTDEQGRYAMKGIPLQVSLRARANAKDLASASSEVFKFNDSAKEKTVDFVLQRGSTISGTARYDDGTPARKKKLTLMPDFGRLMQGDIQEPREAETDDRGGFQITSLGPGEYTLRGGTSPLDFSPFASQDHVLKVTVDGENDVKDLVLVLKPDATASPSSAADAVLRGTVLDANGRPAGNVRVSAVATTDPQDRPSALTSEDGTFSVAGLKNTVYDLSVKSDIGNGAANNVSVSSRPTIRLSAPTPLSGLVTDADGLAVSSCAVQLTGKTNTEQPFDFAKLQESMLGRDTQNTRKTDEFGYFEFKNVDPGDYTIRARSAMKGSAELDVTLYAGRPETGLQIKLKPGVRVSGRVLGVDGAPLPGAAVSLSETANAGGMDMGALMPMFQNKDYAATSDMQGGFSFDSVASANYTLSSELDPYAPTYLRDIAVQPGIDLTGLKVVMLAGGTAEGTVIMGGVPTAGATVQLIGDGGMKMAQTDDDGYFKIENIPSGSYIAQAVDMARMAQGDLSGNLGPKSVEILSGQTTVIDFAPPPGSVPVSGHIEGEIRAMTMLTLRREGGPAPEDFAATDLRAGIEAAQYQIGQAIVRPDGDFEIPGVEPGHYILEVIGFDDPSNLQALMESSRTPLIRQDIEVVADEPLVLNLTLPPKNP